MSVTLKPQSTPLHTAWSPEDRLLFRLVGAYDPATEPAVDAEFAGPVDWDRLADLAVDGGVAPLIYRILRTAGRLDLVPAAAGARLRSVYFLTVAENTRYLECAGRVLAACHQAGIEVIALRGIAFVESLYRDVALRPLSDIDLLVHPAALQGVKAVLGASGYWPVEAHPNQWTNTEVVLDLHVDLMGADRIAARERAARIDIEAVWAASVPAVIAGMRTRTTSWADTVLVCCLHAMKHSCDRLVWFADLAALLKEYRLIDWDGVVSRADRFRLTKPVYYALAYLTATVGADVPTAVMDALRPARTGWMERRCMDRMLRGRPAGRFGEMFTLFMMERTRDRLAFIAETCFPRREVIGQAYGAQTADRPLSRPRRLWHVAEMAFDVVRQAVKA